MSDEISFGKMDKCTVPKVIRVVVEAIIVEQSPVARWLETVMV